MAKSLVIVESPAKAKTLEKYLGKKYKVKASVGHVKDLPKSKLGIKITEDGRFEPEYVTIKGKDKVLREIKKAAKDADIVYLAPDPDREGEAIAWHIAEEICKNSGKKGKKKKEASIYEGCKIKRVLFFEITKAAVLDAMSKAGELNRFKYESQQARRILDRLVGYKISPLLWEKVRRGLSAGRVQSVAVRIICEREREIEAFKPEPYWTIEAVFEGKEPPEFSAKLIKVKNKKFECKNADEAANIVKEIKASSFAVASIDKKEVKRKAPPPFMTSTLQQEAIKQLRFTARKTMSIAQRLYEGVDIGGHVEGLITYMRTDSCRISAEALAATRSLIKSRFGSEYLPSKPFIYKVRKDAHDAHEAIRPTDVNRTPEEMKKYLSRDEYRLYTLIWSRFVACQMKPAVYEQTSIDIKGGDFIFRATGRVKLFDGYLAAYVTSDEEDDSNAAGLLPHLKEGESLSLNKVEDKEHFTQPPPRYTEASLVKVLEEKGIGRPSTYATILSNIVQRRYVQKEQNRYFKPTDLGFLVNDLLVENFPKIMDVKFTAEMEEELDRIEFGEKDWQDVLKSFNGDFEKALKRAQKKMRDVKREEIPTDIKCDKCGKPMVVKWGRNGHFLACSAYPDCRNTKEIKLGPDNKIEIVKDKQVDQKCPECGSPMVLKHGRFGRFLACSRYPECKTTMSIPTGVSCPEEGCGGILVEKRTRKGKIFFGCSNYPKCKYAVWDRPVPQKCPACGHPFVLEKKKKDGVILYCPAEGCGWKGEPQDKA